MPGKQVSVYKARKKSPISNKNRKSKPGGAPRKRTSNDPLAEEEVTRLLRSVTDPADYILFYIGFTTGMRVSEVRALDIGLIDFQERRIKIFDQKKDIYRWIYPPEAPLVALQRFINAGVKSPPLVFPWGEKTIETRIQKWTKNILGKKKSWHCVRHTYITLSRKKKIPMETVVQNTGDSPATIWRYYVNFSADDMREIVNSVPLFTTDELTTDAQ